MTGRNSFLTGSDRDRVLQATAELCAEVGYEELQGEAITAAAGISDRRFHELFDDKEAAVEAAIEAILAAVVELVGSAYSADRSEAESYVMGIKAILETMAKDPAFAHISYLTSRQMAPPRLKESLDSGTGLLAAMLERLWDYSRGDPQPSIAARAALGGAEAVIRREIAHGRTTKLPRLLPDFTYAATVPFLGQRQALWFAQRSRELLVEDRGG